jgi:hypothetical protein
VAEGNRPSGSCSQQASIIDIIDSIQGLFEFFHNGFINGRLSGTDNIIILNISFTVGFVTLDLLLSINWLSNG